MDILQKMKYRGFTELKHGGNIRSGKTNKNIISIGKIILYIIVVLSMK